MPDTRITLTETVAADCLTPAQVETAKAIYAPVTQGRTGEVLVAGFSPGSELGWNTMAGTQPFAPGTDLFKYVVFNNPVRDFKAMNWDSDVDSTRAASTALNASLNKSRRWCPAGTHLSTASAALNHPHTTPRNWQGRCCGRRELQYCHQRRIVRSR